MLDGRHNRLEVVLSRYEAIDVVTIDADNLFITVIVGIHFQLVEVHALVVVIGKPEMINLHMTSSIVKRRTMQWLPCLTCGQDTCSRGPDERDSNLES